MKAWNLDGMMTELAKELKARERAIPSKSSQSDQPRKTGRELSIGLHCSQEVTNQFAVWPYINPS